MSEEEDIAPEIPALVKKYVPGVTRGLSWAKYSKEKSNILEELFSVIKSRDKDKKKNSYTNYPPLSQIIFLKRFYVK